MRPVLLTVNDDSYRAWLQAAIVGHRPRRTHLEVTGADRASFLHNLCTNNIKALAPGQGCEAFFCTAQAKTLGFVDLFCTANSLVMETVADQATPLLTHLDRYLFREQVVLTDRTADWDEWLVAGPNSTDLLARCLQVELPRGDHQHLAVNVGTDEISVRRLATHHESTWQLVGPSAALQLVVDQLMAAGAVRGDQIWEVARVERGTPEYGLDITSENLPPELVRGERAISYHKGCYLGQEPIARIDALGHVNWSLVGLRCTANEAPTEFSLTSGGKALARITSVVYSPRQSAWIALAFLRRGAGTVGAHMITDQGTYEIVGLPFP